MQEHRHSFVRKNAVFAVLTIYQSHEHLIPDAPELLETFLAAESDATCKRNAFVTLCNIAQPVAVRYLVGVLDGLDAMDELMQMAVIELVRLEAKTEGANRVGSVRLQMPACVDLSSGSMDQGYLRPAQLAQPCRQVRGCNQLDRSDAKPSGCQR